MYFSSIGNIIMIQEIGISVDFDPTPLFANLFPAHKEADWVKEQCKLGTISVRKINNSFQFIDDLLSLNDDSTICFSYTLSYFQINIFLRAFLYIFVYLVYICLCLHIYIYIYIIHIFYLYLYIFVIFIYFFFVSLLTFLLDVMVYSL